MTEIVVVKNIGDIRKLAQETGFEMNEGQGRPPLFQVAAHVKEQTGAVLDFSEYGSNKPPAGTKRVRVAKAKPAEEMVTIRAQIPEGDTLVEREVVATVGEVRAASGSVGKRGKTSQNAFVHYAAAQLQVAVTDLRNPRIERTVSVVDIPVSPSDVTEPVAGAETPAEAPKAPAKRKTRAKKVQGVSEPVSDADVPVELDSNSAAE